MGGIYPLANQLQGLAATTDHQSLTTVEDQLCRGPAHREGLTSLGLWCLLSVLLVEVAGGGVLTWSEAVHWLRWLWSFPGGTGQGQPLPVLCWGAPSMSCKVFCRWLFLALGLEVPR